MSGKTDRSFDAHSFISQDYMKVESLIYKSNDIEMYDSKSLEIIEEHNKDDLKLKIKTKRPHRFETTGQVEESEIRSSHQILAPE